MNEPKYRRVLLKISGEALAGDAHRGLNFDVIGSVCDVVKQCVEAGVQVGIVVGGGNFWRGIKDGGDRMERTRADQMGMLATVINCLALADSLEQRGVEVRVQTAIEMTRIAEPYIRGRAIRHLEKGRVVIFGCGTGNPFFSTDTGAVLRAAEINADAILLAKNVDGVYSDDPAKNPDAVKFERIATGKREYLFCAIEAEKTLLVAFDPSEGLKVAFRMLCDDYKLHGNRLETTEIFKDIVGHKRITVWEFGDRPVSVSVSVAGTRPVYSLTEKILPFAFFEEFPVGGDVSDYLTLRLRPRADELADFLGEFTSVLPPPHFAPQDSVLLLRNNGIDYAKAEMCGGAIDNVTLIDKQDHTW